MPFLVEDTWLPAAGLPRWIKNGAQVARIELGPEADWNAEK